LAGSTTTDSTEESRKGDPVIHSRCGGNEMDFNDEPSKTDFSMTSEARTFLKCYSFDSFIEVKTVLAKGNNFFGNADVR
jgi:hypothetical protein